MKRLAITTAAALTTLAAACTFGGWVYEGQWGSWGAGNGDFDHPWGLTCAPNGNVYVADEWNHRIQYFRPTGSFLGKWGIKRTRNGHLNHPVDIAFNRGGDRVYVVDHDNHRVQYFRWSDPAVSPASLGRVKALFQ